MSNQRTWYCPACGNVNPLEHAACVRCGEPRRAPADPRRQPPPGPREQRPL